MALAVLKNYMETKHQNLSNKYGPYVATYLVAQYAKEYKIKYPWLLCSECIDIVNNYKSVETFSIDIWTKMIDYYDRLDSIFELLDYDIKLSVVKSINLSIHVKTTKYIYLDTLPKCSRSRVRIWTNKFLTIYYNNR